MPYPFFTLDRLKDIAAKHTATDVLQKREGACLLTTHGARLLGLYPQPDLPNLLWVHRNVEKLLADGAWMVGGERLWVAPERNFYYENPRDFEGFHVPTDIDPGNYQPAGAGVYESVFPLLDISTNRAYDGCRARRRFVWLDDPYRTGLPYAGVRIDDSITVPSTTLAFSAWSLAMVYTCGPEQPGTALFPVRRNGSILSYFSPIPLHRADVRDGYARLLIDGAEIYKLAIAPEDMLFANPLKAIYVSPLPGSDRWCAVVKRTDDMPRSQADCLDLAKGNPHGPKGAIQSYNSGPSNGADEETPFGEIELQLPKATAMAGSAVSAASHELLGYVASRAEVLELARHALGLSAPPELYA